MRLANDVHESTRAKGACWAEGECWPGMGQVEVFERGDWRGFNSWGGEGTGEDLRAVVVVVVVIEGSSEGEPVRAVLL